MSVVLLKMPKANDIYYGQTCIIKTCAVVLVSSVSIRFGLNEFLAYPIQNHIGKYAQKYRPKAMCARHMSQLARIVDTELRT
jgi:hypothetical protein